MEFKKPEKKLKVYKENDQFVIEKVNQFNHATKRYFMSEEGLKEGLDAYWLVMDEYETEVSDDLWGMVIKHLNK